MPWVPRTSSKSTFVSGAPPIHSAAVRSAASMTPPVAPKMAPAPVDSPIGSSKSSSGSRAKLMPARWIIRAASRVVSTMSVSGTPAAD